MCGIIGCVSRQDDALNILLSGLKALEYRGYDSAGIAYVANQKIEIKKQVGKIAALEAVVDLNKKVNLGIGHTRWATHGAPNQLNSHPHSCGKITLVHNGIIENYEELKKNLNIKLISDTDTEVIAALINHYYLETKDMLKAIKSYTEVVRGSYALGIICHDELNSLYAVKKGSPLIIGIKDEAKFIASDIPAFLNQTNQYTILNDDEIAQLTATQIKYFDQNLKSIIKEELVFDNDIEAAEKNGFDHFMLKEIFEEPSIIKNLINHYFVKDSFVSLLEKIPDLNKYESINIVACGSAYHAGLIGKIFFEKTAGIETHVEIASEYRYKTNFYSPKKLVIIISQSGETADSLASLRVAKENGADILALVNVIGSSIVREAKMVVYTQAGPEIAVATTKAFSAQIFTLALMALKVAFQQGKIKTNLEEKIIKDARELSNKLEQVVNNENLKLVALSIASHENVFFIGRGIDAPLCLEGSLKLKEISYIHSEAYPAGELKHGTLSLITNEVPVIAVISDLNLAEKTISNIMETKARGGKIILIVTEDVVKKCALLEQISDQMIIIPETNEYFKPLLVIASMQLIAYNVTLLRNYDPDQPRNLAKSVTVE